MREMSREGERGEDRVRERAYALWEEAGRPESASEHYWGLARRGIERETEEEIALAGQPDVKPETNHE
jgi:hypothetical protein